MYIGPTAWGPSKGLLSLNHVMMGVGLPSALQFRVTVSYNLFSFLSTGRVVKTGALPVSSSVEQKGDIYHY